MDATERHLAGGVVQGSPAASTRRAGVSVPAGTVLTAGAAQLAITCFHLVTAAPAALLARYTADDAFYYFDIARNFPRIQATPGITTTGFHPLYWATLVPIFHIGPGMAGVRAALLMLMAAHVLAGWMLFVLLRRRWGPMPAAALAILWIASAELRTVVLYGVESALVEVAVLGVLLACDHRAMATLHRCLAIGVAVAVAYLARNDSLFVCVPVAAAWFWEHRKEMEAQRIRWIGFAVAATAVVVAPWALFLAWHGSLIPDSAQALPLLSTGSLSVSASGVETTVATFLASLTFNQAVSAGQFALDVGMVWVLVGALGASRMRGRWRAPDVALWVSVPVLLALYVLFLHGVRAWYMVYVGVWVFAAVLPPLASAVTQVVKGGRWRAPVGVACAAAVAIAGLLATPFANNPQEGQKYQAALRAAAIVGPDARLASFNSGIYQFFLAPRDVDNLDGVVNPIVVPYLRRHDLCRYLADRRIGWLIDNGTSALASEPGVDVGQPITLVRGTGAPDVTGQPQLLASIHLTRCPAT